MITQTALEELYTVAKEFDADVVYTSAHDLLKRQFVAFEFEKMFAFDEF